MGLQEYTRKAIVLNKYMILQPKHHTITVL